MSDLRWNLLHVYGPWSWHGDAYIVGDRDGLRLLRDAIDDAIERGEGVARDVMQSDGEGYDVCVLVRSQDAHPTLAVSYTDEYAREPRGANVAWPWALWKEPPK